MRKFMKTIRLFTISLPENGKRQIDETLPYAAEASKYVESDIEMVKSRPVFEKKMIKI